MPHDLLIRNPSLQVLKEELLVQREEEGGWRREGVHASTIRGMCVVGGVIFTVGADQRVRTEKKRKEKKRKRKRKEKNTGACAG